MVCFGKYCDPYQCNMKLPLKLRFNYWKEQLKVFVFSGQNLEHHRAHTRSGGLNSLLLERCLEAHQGMPASARCTAVGFLLAFTGVADQLLTVTVLYWLLLTKLGLLLLQCLSINFSSFCYPEVWLDHLLMAHTFCHRLPPGRKIGFIIWLGAVLLVFQ